jgi:TonB family protein
MRLDAAIADAAIRLYAGFWFAKCKWRYSLQGSILCKSCDHVGAQALPALSLLGRLAGIPALNEKGSQNFNAMFRKLFLVLVLALPYAESRAGLSQPDTLLQPKDKDSVHTAPHQMARFPGGENAMLTYISQAVKYPEKARRDNIQGTVYASFIVESDGMITSIQILRGVHQALDKEVLRVLSLMPAWEPALHFGEEVRSRFILPVRFSLKGKERKNKRKR